MSYSELKTYLTSSKVKCVRDDKVGILSPPTWFELPRIMVLRKKSNVENIRGVEFP